jgi:hypothetical protein
MSSYDIKFNYLRDLTSLLLSYVKKLSVSTEISTVSITGLTIIASSDCNSV